MELIRNIFLEARIASEEERAVVALALEGGFAERGRGFERWKLSNRGRGERERERTWWIRLGTERVKRAFPRTRTDYWATQQGEEEGKTGRGGQRDGEMKRRGGGRGGWLNERGGGSALGRVLRGTRERVGERVSGWRLNRAENPLQEGQRWVEDSLCLSLSR